MRLQAALDGRLFTVAPVSGDDFLALLPMLPGVVRGSDGRIRVKGGRPAETGLAIGPTYASNPVVGEAGVSLPVDAVETIEVVGNPYTAEYGRFSAGVTRVDTRRGGERWRTVTTNFIPIPCLKVCAGGNWGVRNFNPRLVVSGPLLPKHLFLAQSFQYRDRRERIPSLPEGEADTTLRSLDAFTRLDATLGRHVVTTTAAFFPQDVSFVGLNTFNRRPVTPSLTRRGFSAAVHHTWRAGGTALLETSISRMRHDVTVAGQAFGVMTITPSGNDGSFFNRSARRSTSTQFVESLSFAKSGAGQHLVKVGVDVLRTAFEGTSESAPVEVRRADGSLSERYEYGGPRTFGAEATDLAVFGEDRWRVSDRLLVATGLRVDREGVTRLSRMSPRLEVSLSAAPGGRSIVRGGVGRFVSRTPLLASAFEMIDAPAVQRFDADGRTPSSAPSTYAGRFAGPRVPAWARVWNLGFDQRLPADMLFRINYLARDGHHALVVDPLEHGPASALVLASTGRSRYRETEVSWRYVNGTGRELSVSYVRSRAEADLNAFDADFGTVRRPIIRANEFGLTDTDVPNRVLAFGVLPIGAWQIAPLLEVRSGFPYSLVDADHRFVGPRNAGARFPIFRSLDLSVSRAMSIAGRRVRAGLRMNHVFGNDTPRDVYNNIASPLFGTFANSLVRRLSLTVEFQP